MTASSSANWRTVLTDPVHFLAFGGGTGLSPVAPGTAGSLFAVALWLAADGVPVWVTPAVAVLLFAIGIPITGASARRLGVHDHPGIVLDEIAGMLLVLSFVPREIFWVGCAFALFRVADIFKPWPIRDLDHSLDGGLGIMLDDALAAAYTVLALVLLDRILPF